MKYTRGLLNTFLSLRWTNEQIQTFLTHHSCEIEETHTRTIDHRIVVGYVTDVNPHPDADKLVICTVDCGPHGIKTICTGASNVQTKAYYPTALSGAVMPAIGLTINDRVMRGVPSQGMLCAKTELGIDEDSHIHGIWDMNDDVVVTDDMIGKSVRDLFPWLAGDILEVDNKTITNRPDLTGHRGLANELYALAKIHDPSAIGLHTIDMYRDIFNQRNIIQALTHGTQAPTRVSIQTSGCDSYVLCQFSHVITKPSSMYLRTLLRDAGINPKNTVVDLSNLLMVLFGQPTHFFDTACIQGSIVVRDAHAGEKFVDLTGKDYVLTPDDIVIADDHKVLALAGVIGGQSSAISDTTTQITCEIAHFDPISIRKTAQRHTCRTDASMRYEKNPNPVLPFFVHYALMDMIKRYQYDIGQRQYQGHSFACNPRMHDLLSSPLQIITQPHKLLAKILQPEKTQQTDETNNEQRNTTTITTALTALGFSVAHHQTHDSVSIIVPQWRGHADIAIIEDLTEEIARIMGYDSITPHMPSFPLRQASMTPLIIRKRMAQDHGIRWNMTHLETYPWIEESYLTPYGYTNHDCIQLQNPVDTSASSLRPTILSSLLKACVTNHKRFGQINIMDIGQVRIPSSDNNQQNEKKREEQTHRGVLHASKKQPQTLAEDGFYHLKELIEQFLNPAYQGQRHHDDNHNAHPRQSLVYHSPTQQPLAQLVTIHPSLLTHLKLDDRHVCVGWINLSDAHALTQARLRDRTQHIATLSDHVIKRDLTFVCPKNIPSDRIITTVSAHHDVIDVIVRDVYEGKPLADDQKSLSITYTIRPHTTPTTEQINAIMNEIVDAVAQQGGFLRME